LKDPEIAKGGLVYQSRVRNNGYIKAIRDAIFIARRRVLGDGTGEQNDAERESDADKKANIKKRWATDII